MELTVLLPCLNEEKTVAECVRKALSFIRKAGVSGEVLVADNGSSDGSARTAEMAGARVVRVEDRGYGSAIRGGIASAMGTYIVMADADGSYDFLSIGPFLARLRGGCDLVMGNRFAGGILPGAMPFLHRYLGNPVLTAIGKAFFGCRCGDFHCGMRGFTKKAALEMDLRSSGMELASEMVIKATVLGMRVDEVPTVLSPDGRGKRSHLRTWRDGWRHLRFMLLFSPNWLFVYPGLVLMAAGVLVGVPVAAGPVHVGRAVLDVHTLLFCAAGVVVGFQAVIFGLLGRALAVEKGFLPGYLSPVARAAENGTLEFGVAAGAAVFLAGLAGAVVTLSRWTSADFGNLDPVVTLRTAIPATAAMIVGLQASLASFFLGALAMRERPGPRASDGERGRQ